MTGPSPVRGGTAADRHGRLAPPPDVLAAIEAAVALAWPQPLGGGAQSDPRRAGAAWRFSGRWWAAPQSLRRDRP